MDVDSEQLRKKKEKREKQEQAEAEYKRITRSLSSLNRNEDLTTIQRSVADHIAKSKELYPIIKKKLTGSSADAKHIRSVLQISGDTAKRINATANPFVLKKIIESMKYRHKNKLCEIIVKEHVVTCFRIPPTFEFFYGAIKKEGLIIKERRKRAKVEIVATRSTTATEKNLNTDVEQDSTPKEVAAIYEKINNLTRAKPNRVRFFQTIIDPISFTQTVENIFHTSFLVKEGRVGVKKGAGNKAILTSGEDRNDSQDKSINPKQSILSFTMADYNKWKSRSR